ncbi:MAG: mttA/Hcf106 family-domain-containing protein [Monoraphidium minutum]|nr:MAG: mttA/Hcf106 family-domain-containing protein [Monoraphidium minutum]
MLATSRGAASALRTRPQMTVCAAGVSMPRSRAVPLTASPSGPARFTGLPARPLPGRSIPIGLPSSQPLLTSTGARRETVARSFLGVGAPEALLVAVVALVVFGPKGLADAAKSVGTALRAFQPTIREVVEVSQDLKGTLEKELGLDEIREAARVPVTPRPRPVSSGLDSDEDPDIEAKRAASASAAWANAPVASAAPSAAEPAAANVPQQLERPAAAPAKDLGALSMEELEAELARRRGAGGGSGAAPAGQQQQQRPEA